MSKAIEWIFIRCEKCPKADAGVELGVALMDDGTYLFRVACSSCRQPIVDFDKAREFARNLFKRARPAPKVHKA